MKDEPIDFINQCTFSAEPLQFLESAKMVLVAKSETALILSLNKGEISSVKTDFATSTKSGQEAYRVITFTRYTLQEDEQERISVRVPTTWRHRDVDRQNTRRPHLEKSFERCLLDESADKLIRADLPTGAPMRDSAEIFELVILRWSQAQAQFHRSPFFPLFKRG